MERDCGGGRGVLLVLFVCSLPAFFFFKYILQSTVFNFFTFLTIVVDIFVLVVVQTWHSIQNLMVKGLSSMKDVVTTVPLPRWTKVLNHNFKALHCAMDLCMDFLRL